MTHERRLRLARAEEAARAAQQAELDEALRLRVERMRRCATAIAWLGLFLAVAMLVAGNYMATVGFAVAGGLAISYLTVLDLYREARHL